MAYKYDQICDALKTKIQKGIYAADTSLPPENTLALEYGVSRITIRNALAVLIDEGYVYPVPGKGNFVLSPKNDRYLFSLKPEKILKSGYDRVNLLGSDIIKPTIELVYHLRVAPDSRIIQINWLLFYHDIAVAYDIQIIPYASGMTLWEDDFTYSDFSEVIQHKNALPDYSESVSIEAINAPDTVSEKLSISSDSPVLLISEKVMDDDQPLGMRKLYIRSDYCRLTGVSLLT
ncbi:MAG: GntR family transcriptional regulator [Eubacteriaceae bacterium]|jgi:GntR family transcriptional regulator|nr:GntR family transcriptional regulator [Eubacteriaceae bacterium]MDK2904867.1 GntR family transcriptional regulator [Eubacteriaceae bacterium]MDK2937352.1 GntR family transcriptional regulator [Eubacteriaceae bacterium]MDK2961999.1 GntR family transcriptional regulator [Eubacteriaceae bacterium]MDN5307729.1 GntR family transcriptional regulator [Eubacteriaceae bacterium]